MTNNYGSATSTLNFTTVTIPNLSRDGRMFARLVATVPGTYSGTYSSAVSGSRSAVSETTLPTKVVRARK